MNNSSNKSNSSKITIIILTLLLAVLAYFAYTNYTKNKESEAVLKESEIVLLEEKRNIQADLDKKILDLDKAIADNTSMESELTAARNNIITFKDSVSNLKNLNYKIIRRYKSKLVVLEASNKKLFKTIDSLRIINYNIAVERDSAQAVVERQASTIEVQTQDNQNLSEQNTELSKKISKAATLAIDNVAVIAMKERRGGKLKNTERARRVDAFRVSFKIRKNVIAEAGLKKAHIVIKDASGIVLSSEGTFTNNDGVKMPYTDTTDVEYKNEDLDVILVTTLTEEKLEKGDYYLSVFLDNMLLGSTSIYLK